MFVVLNGLIWFDVRFVLVMMVFGISCLVCLYWFGLFDWFWCYAGSWLLNGC